MKYLETERFIITQGDNASQKNYRDNYDTIFGKKDESVGGPACAGCGVCLQVDERPLCCEECYRHDAACAKLCTEGAECDCGVG